jgi:hypothetical protein
MANDRLALALFACRWGFLSRFFRHTADVLHQYGPVFRVTLRESSKLAGQRRYTACSLQNSDRRFRERENVEYQPMKTNAGDVFILTWLSCLGLIVEALFLCFRVAFDYVFGARGILPAVLAFSRSSLFVTC